MAHFAQIDENNVVVRVLLIEDVHEKNGQEYLSETLGLGGRWIQTSYNHKIRRKFAGIGDIYDEENDIFIDAKPYDSWIQDGFGWKAPKAQPKEGRYFWDENIKDWVSFGETL